MARPKLDIDPKLVETFTKFGANNCEIADYFGCTEGAIRKRFSEIITKARASRKVKLREMQWKSAEKGNVTMQIWLGKQELGQSDKVEEKQTSEISQTIIYESQWGKQSSEG
jgi:hypothetical protein